MPETARDALAYAAGALTPARKVGELLDAHRAEVRAEVLAAEADLIVAHCPDHGPQDQNGVWMDCHCAVADDLRRRATPAPAVVPAR